MPCTESTVTVHPSLCIVRVSLSLNLQEGNKKLITAICSAVRYEQSKAKRNSCHLAPPSSQARPQAYKNIVRKVLTIVHASGWTRHHLSKNPLCKYQSKHPFFDYRVSQNKSPVATLQEQHSMKCGHCKMPGKLGSTETTSSTEHDIAQVLKILNEQHYTENPRKYTTWKIPVPHSTIK